MRKIQNYINGTLCPPESGSYLPNIQPFTGEVMSEIPDSDENDVEKAVQAARRAFPAWSLTPAEKRADILEKIAAGIEARLDFLAELEMLDSGKPLWLTSEVDIPRGAANFRFFSRAVSQFASESHFMETGAINYTLRKPIGVVGCISPWNLPLYLFTWKIAPALAAGNCVVAKPSELTPETAAVLAEICIEAGLPPGVLNIVHGTGARAGNAIVEHTEIKAISFTGGTKTGEMIARSAAPRFKKLSLELGGKNPAIIWKDVNLDEVVPQIRRLAFTNQGQICLCGSRILVHADIYEAFKEKFIQAVNEIQVGDPRDASNFMGALISEAHLEKIVFYTNLAMEEGGILLTGGKRKVLTGEAAGGYYFEPTVFEGLNQTSRTNTEEIFGPVVTLQKFASEEEAVQLSNATGYGLAATLWTNDLKLAHRLAEQVEVGIFWVNCWLLRDLRTPFGGVKNSGVGREGGWEALRFFTEPKNVCIKYR